MAYAVIQGSSKGIGKALARHLLQNTSIRVIGTTAGSASQAKNSILEGFEKNAHVNRLQTISMDVTDEEHVRRASEEIKEEYGREMKLLVNVSGILHAERALSEVSYENLLKTFQINTFGHLLVYKHFLSLLPPRKAKRGGPTGKVFDGKEENDAKGLLPDHKSLLVSLSARVGSIGDNKKGGWYSYRSSKAATNQIIRTLAHELHYKSIPASALAYHPGTVQTQLSEKYVGNKEPDQSKGLFTPEMAAVKFFGVLGRGEWESGWFVDWRGEKVEW